MKLSFLNLPEQHRHRAIDEAAIPGWRRGRISSVLVAFINSKIQEFDAPAGG